MPLTSVDAAACSPGSGGVNLVGEDYIDSGSGLPRFIPFSGIVIGTQNGTYELIGPGASLPVTITDSSVTIDDGDGSITVDGEVDAVQSGDWAVQIQSTAGDDLVATTTTPSAGASGLVVRTVGPNDQGEPSSADNAWPIKVSNGTDTATLTTVSAKIGLDVNIIGGTATGSSATDDAAFTFGTGSITIAGGVYSASRDNVSDGDGGALGMTIKRALLTCLETPSGDTVIDDGIDAVRMALVDGTGTQITSFGGGTEYLEGATDSSLSGHIVMWEDTADTVRAVSAAHPFPVEVVGGAAVGGTSMTDSDPFTFASSGFTPSGGVYNNSRDTLTSGDGGAFAITPIRGQYVVLESVGGVALSLADNTGFTDGTSHVLAAGFIFDEVAGTALTENDAAAARIDSKRAQVIVFEDATTRGQRAAVSAAGALAVNKAQIAGNTISAGLGTAGTGTQRVVEANCGTGTVTSVSASASSVTLLASNANRRGASFYNDSEDTLYLKCAATASTSSFTVKLGPGDYFELQQPIYTGIVDGIWDGTDGAVRVTEYT